jgi:hypothetical protein
MLFRSSLAVLLLGATTIGAAAAPFHHPFGEWREYSRDWLAACPDKVNEKGSFYAEFSCFASTYSQERNSANLPAYSLTVIRNRLTGELDIALTLADTQRNFDTTRPLVLQFAGDPPEQLDFTADLETRYNTSNQFFLLDPQRKAELLQRFKDRSAVELQVPIEGAPKPWTTRLSLRGLNASLDFMEAYARRIEQF